MTSATNFWVGYSAHVCCAFVIICTVCVQTSLRQFHHIFAQTPRVDGCAARMQARRQQPEIITPHLRRALVATQPPRCLRVALCSSRPHVACALQAMAVPLVGHDARKNLCTLGRASVMLTAALLPLLHVLGRVSVAQALLIELIDTLAAQFGGALRRAVLYLGRPPHRL